MTYYKFEQNMLCFQFYSDRCRKTYPYFVIINFLFHLPGNKGRGEEEELLQRENGRHRKGGKEEEEEPAGNDSRADRERRIELRISVFFYKKGEIGYF